MCYIAQANSHTIYVKVNQKKEKQHAYWSYFLEDSRYCSYKNMAPLQSAKVTDWITSEKTHRNQTFVEVRTVLYAYKIPSHCSFPNSTRNV